MTALAETDLPEETIPGTWQEGARLGVPVAVAAALVAMSFGILAAPVMGSWAAIAMSAIVFAGAAQFAALAVLADGGGALAAIVAGILLNLRFVPMSVSVAPWVRGGWLSRLGLAATITDASWALSSRGGGRFDPRILAGATLPQYLLWVAGTAVGALGGDVIGDPAALGLDAVFPAFFLGLLFGEARSPRARAAAVAGAAIALVMLPLAPPGVPVLAASAAGALGLIGRRTQLA